MNHVNNYNIHGRSEIYPVDENCYRATTYDGVDFLNLKCESKNFELLNDSLNQNGIHFIYPKSEDVLIKISGKTNRDVRLNYNNTSIFINNDTSANTCTLNSNYGQEISVLSIGNDFFKHHPDSSIKTSLMYFYNTDLEDVFYFKNCASDERITEKVDKVKRFIRITNPRHLLVKSTLSELQYIFIQQYLIKNNHNILNPEEIERIEQLPEIILEHSSIFLTAEKLAEQINMTVDKLQLGCEIVFNCGLMDLINDIKFKTVSNQLLNSNKSFADIAYLNGYANRTYFYKIFHERYKCNPLEF